MIIRNPRSLAFALLITTLPVGFALAAGRGGGGLGQGVGQQAQAEPRWAVEHLPETLAAVPVGLAVDRLAQMIRPATDRLERATRPRMPVASADIPILQYRK